MRKKKKSRCSKHLIFLHPRSGSLCCHFVFLCTQEAVPFAVVGSNTVIEVRSRKIRGRQYPWGVVEVENPEHCDFIKLRTMLMCVRSLNILLYASIWVDIRKSWLLIVRLGFKSRWCLTSNSVEQAMHVKSLEFNESIVINE